MRIRILASKYLTGSKPWKGAEIASLMRFRIRIHLITLMRNRIPPFNLMRIHAELQIRINNNAHNHCFWIFTSMIPTFLTLRWPWMEGAMDLARMSKTSPFCLENFLHFCTSSPEKRIQLKQNISSLPHRRKKCWTAKIFNSQKHRCGSKLPINYVGYDATTPTYISEKTLKPRIPEPFFFWINLWPTV